MIEPKTVSTITSASRLFNSAARATSSTSSALVICLLYAANFRRPVRTWVYLDAALLDVCLLRGFSRAKHAQVSTAKGRKSSPKYDLDASNLEIRGSNSKIEILRGAPAK